MSAGTVRIGVLGCGVLARAVHLPLLAGLPGARVVALAEPDPERRKEAYRLVPTATAHAEAAEVLARADVDAVVVCLPPVLHAGAALAALRAGKHLYLEKPLATTSAEAGAVLDAWRSSTLVGMIGFNYRRSPLYAALRAALSGGAIGRPVAMRTAFTTAAAQGAPPAWRQCRAEGGGVLRDLAPHHIDLVRHLLDDEIAEVSAAAAASRRTEGDTVTLELRTAGGVPVQCLFAAHAVEEDRVEIIGEGGTLIVDRYRSLAVTYRPPEARRTRAARLRDGLRALAGLRHLLEKRRSPWHEPSYRRALAAFVNAVAAGQAAPVPDLEDGYRALAVIEAAEVAVTGRGVAPVASPAAAPPAAGGAERAVARVS